MVQRIGQENQRIDMSEVNRRQAEIAAYDRLTSEMQSLANAIERDMTKWSNDVQASVAELRRIIRPSELVQAHIEMRDNLTLDGEAIGEVIAIARNVVLPSQKLASDAQKALASITMGRELAAEQEKDLCANYAGATERLQAQVSAGSTVERLRDELDELNKELAARLVELTRLEQNDKIILAKAPTSIANARAAGDAARVKLLEEAVQRSQNRMPVVANQKALTNSAQGSAATAQADNAAAMNLLNTALGK
jgi:hypothetical protein